MSALRLGGASCRLVVFAVAWLAACAPDAPVAQHGADMGTAHMAQSSVCANATLPTITSRGVGPIVVGDSMPSLGGSCSTTDAVFTIGHGAPGHATVVRFGQHAVVVVAEGELDSVARVVVHDPAFRTDNGIGVGSTVGDVRARYGAVRTLRGLDGHVRVAPMAPGISFVVDSTPAASLRDAVRDDARVSAVWIAAPPSADAAGR